MYAVTATFGLHPARLPAFMDLMLDNARTSLRQETGCRQFDVCSDPARPGIVFLYELYVDRAAFDLHLTSPHFLDFDKAVSDMIVSKQVNTFSEVRQ